MTTRHLRLYSDLAWLWPMWGSHEAEYADYCVHATALLRQHARRPLESMLVLSCGGGKNVFNLKREFRVSGLDLSEDMLALARRLNPECEFFAGDMRDFDLGRRFDAVFIDDGISHMTRRADLEAVFRTAHLHLEPGGALLVTPDVTRESFVQNRTTVAQAEASASPAGVEVVFVENVFDPDPADESFEFTLVYLIRERGILRIETDGCELGLFSIDAWRAALADSGFLVREAWYRQGDDQYLNFVCTVS